jgi:hypothetical protein
MNKHFFASSVRRWVAPLVLAATTFCGTLGFSSVASAQEPARDGIAGSHVAPKGPREHRGRVAHHGWDERERGERRHHGHERPGRHGHGHGGDHREGHHDGRGH